MFGEVCGYRCWNSQFIGLSNGWVMREGFQLFSFCGVPKAIGAVDEEGRDGFQVFVLR